MGKKVSPLLFRTNKFNNYKNVWVFNYIKNLNIPLVPYYKLNKLFNNSFLNFKIIYFNNLYRVCGKLNINQFKHKITQKFIVSYTTIKFSKLSLLFILYKLDISIISIPFIKLFIKFNLLKSNSIQNLYNILHTNLLAEYINKKQNFIGLKIIISGRLNNTKLANSETFKFGFLSLQKIDTFVAYDQFYLVTKYGLLGVKIWLEKDR